jgi:hypothetical protein
MYLCACDSDRRFGIFGDGACDGDLFIAIPIVATIREARHVGFWVDDVDDRVV